MNETILTFSAPANVNGHRKQLRVNIDKKEYSIGCFIFFGKGVELKSKKALDELAFEFKEKGFKEVK